MDTLRSEDWSSDAGSLNIIPHEFYCTLCGVPFWEYIEDSGLETFSEDDENDQIWLSYFLARKLWKLEPVGVAPLC